MAESFFDEQEEQSRVKAEIVVDYFDAWSRIMAKRAERVGYFDLYAGPGRYRTGESSTPLLILEHAVASPDLSTRLVSVFNDKEPEHTRSLQSEIAKLDGIERLRYRPEVYTGEVDEELAAKFEEINTIPAITFMDPWGYRGLSTRLIRAVVKDWGCEAIFFFNYNRINMGISNYLVEPHMEALFGEDRLARLRSEIGELRPEDREALVRKALGETFEEMGAPYLIPFSFLRPGGRVSHYICFVSKHPLGYRIMKQIMANKGAVDADGVPRFEYVPQTGGRQLPLTTDRPLAALPGRLLQQFAGRTLSVGTVIEQDQVGSPFIPRNYKRVLLNLEEEGEIACDPDRESRRAGTMADHVLLSFPSRLG